MPLRSFKASRRENHIQLILSGSENPGRGLGAGVCEQNPIRDEKVFCLDGSQMPCLIKKKTSEPGQEIENQAETGGKAE